MGSHVMQFLPASRVTAAPKLVWFVHRRVDDNPEEERNAQDYYSESQIDPVLSPNLNPNPLSFPSTIFFRRKKPSPSSSFFYYAPLLLSLPPFHPGFVYIEGFTISSYHPRKMLR